MHADVQFQMAQIDADNAKRADEIQMAQIDADRARDLAKIEVDKELALKEMELQVQAQVNTDMLLVIYLLLIEMLSFQNYQHPWIRRMNVTCFVLNVKP